MSRSSLGTTDTYVFEVRVVLTGGTTFTVRRHVDVDQAGGAEAQREAARRLSWVLREQIAKAEATNEWVELYTDDIGGPAVVVRARDVIALRVG